MKKLFLYFLLISFIVTVNFQSICSQTFVEETGIILKGVSGGTIAWGDFDNDGNLDILLTGSDISDKLIAKIYRNNGDGTFTEQTNIKLPPIYNGNFSLGDYNNDGLLDILMTGDVRSDVNSLIAKIFRNNGDYSFTEQSNIILEGVGGSSVAWGDYNNDGYIDILLTGYTNSEIAISKIYRNNGDGTFSEQTNIKLDGLYFSSVAWGDYNNDGLLDILVTGKIFPSYNLGSFIFKNNGDNTFTKQTSIKITPVYGSSVAWGDYDNDGYLDFLLVGDSSFENNSPVSKIYHNNGDGTFTEQTNIQLTGVSSCSVSWGDYDNDGFLDILFSGTISPSFQATKIYHNNGNGTFTELTGITIPKIDNCSVAWGDFNNDGYLDFVLSGDTGDGYISKIYRNTTLAKSYKATNIPPSAPTNLHITSNQNGNVTFAWDQSTDTETPQKGLSYNLYVYDNIQNTYLRSPQGFKQTDPKNGRRLIAKMGDIRYNAAGYTLKNISSGNYQWSVQAIDAGFKGGAFATEQSFNVLNLSKVAINVAGGELKNTSADIEYSINSTDGINGDWAMCSSQSTTVNYGVGGFDIWVHEHATPSNKIKVASIAAQITPAFTIDYSAETTVKAIADSVEYSTSPDMSGVISGTNTKLTVTPGTNLYFRVKATSLKVISAIETIIVPSRTTPAYSVDFTAETTTQIVPTTDLYSVNSNMSASSIGTGVKIKVTPGQNLFFQSKATQTNFKSLIQTLSVSERKLPPSNVLENNTTNTLDWTNNSSYSNYSDYEYTVDNGLSWTTCNAKPVNVGNINIAIGSAQVRVKAVAGQRFCSLPLKSDAAYTIGTGIVEISTLGIRVYPNPATHTLKIENLPASTEATIWSSEGKQLKTQHLESKNNEIDVTNLAKGLYILKLQNKTINAETKFMKQ